MLITKTISEAEIIFNNTDKHADVKIGFGFYKITEFMFKLPISKQITRFIGFENIIQKRQHFVIYRFVLVIENRFTVAAVTYSVAVRRVGYD